MCIGEAHNQYFALIKDLHSCFKTRIIVCSKGLLKWASKVCLKLFLSNLTTFINPEIQKPVEYKLKTNY